MKEREQYINDLKAKLDDINNKLDVWEAKAGEANAESKAKIHETIANLKEQRSDVSAKLEELKSSSGNAWDEVKVGVEAAYQNLKSAFDNAAKHFK